jgi:hypothetical protein
LYLADQLPVTLANRADPCQSHTLPEICQQTLEYLASSIATVNSKAIDDWATDKYSLCTQAQCFDNVHPSANARIEQHGHFMADRIDDFRENIQGPDGSIDLTTCGRISTVQLILRDILRF